MKKQQGVCLVVPRGFKPERSGDACYKEVVLHGETEDGVELTCTESTAASFTCELVSVGGKVVLPTSFREVKLVWEPTAEDVFTIEGEVSCLCVVFLCGWGVGSLSIGGLYFSQCCGIFLRCFSFVGSGAAFCRSCLYLSQCAMNLCFFLWAVCSFF